MRRLATRGFSRRLVVAWALSACAFALALAPAMPVRAQPQAAPGQCIGLVLGGGGARGAAHIGVLEVLEREHIPVCRIAGTSMGSIVGGLYAAGYTPGEMRKLVATLDWGDLFSDDPARAERPMRRKAADYRYLLNFEIGYKNGRIVTPTGVVQGQKLLLLLRRLLISTWDVHDFDQLPIPFRAVGTDIVNGKAVIFGSGDLPLAIRSSMSVPGAFAPTNVDGALLVDGGIMDNVPIDVIRTMGTDRVIAVDVGSPLLEREQLTNPVALLNQMVGTLMNDKTKAMLATLGDRDLLITPALGKFGSDEFNRCDEAANIGHAAAEAMLPQLRAFAVSDDVWKRYMETRHKRRFDPGLIAFLEVDESKTETASYIKLKMQPDVGKPLDADKLEKDIGAIYGRGNYQQIDYHLTQDGGDNKGLLILPVDKPWGPVYGRFGLQLDNDFQGLNQYMLSAEINVTNVNRYGAEWRTSIWTGRVAGLRTELYQPMGEGAAFSLMPFGLTRTEDIPVFDQNESSKQLAEYRVHRLDGGLEASWSPVSYWRLFGDIERGRDQTDLRIGDASTFPAGTIDFSVLRLGYDWDTFDDAQFPSRGSRIEFTYNMFRPVLGGDHNGDVVRLRMDWVPDWWEGRYHLLLGTSLSSATDNANFFETQSFLGGFLNLSGFSERALYGNQSLFGRAVLYRQTGALDTLFSTPFFIGASFEAGNTWHSTNAVSLGNLLYGGSIFAGVKTPLGPVFLGYGYAQGGHNALYLTFGSLLRQEQ